MDILINILTIVCTPLFTALGIILHEKGETKRKQLEVGETKETNSFIRAEDDIKKLSQKVDALSDMVHEMKASHQQTMTMIEILSDRVEKHNNVIERTYALEKAVAVLDNREKVSENRLTDLERHEEKAM